MPIWTRKRRQRTPERERLAPGFTTHLNTMTPLGTVNKETTMTRSLLPTLTHTRRRFLGSAALTVLAAHLGTKGSARARTTTTNAGALPAREEPSMTATATPATVTADLHPFQVDVAQADLDGLRQHLAAMRLPSKEDRKSTRLNSSHANI